MFLKNGTFVLEEKQRNAEVFFASQRNRVGKIGKELLAATGNILPPSRESKTITELAELCRLTQIATREKLDALRSCLKDEEYTVKSPRKTNFRQRMKSINEVSISSPSLDREYNRTKTKTTESNAFRTKIENKFLSDYGGKSETPLLLVTTIGGPLESVLEAEYETDGMTTPGSNLESPFFSSVHCGFNRDVSATPSVSTKKINEQKRRTSSSFSPSAPRTPPTLDKLRISDSTNRLLRYVEHGEENIEDSGHDMTSSNETSFSKENSNKPVIQDQYHSQKQEQEQQHLFEFRDEDDMITLDTTMTKNTTLYSPMMHRGSNNEERSSVEERSQFYARMEGILERVEETILEESQSPITYPDETKVYGDQPRQHSILSSSSDEKNSARPELYSSKKLFEGNSGTIPSEIDEYSAMSFSSDSTNMVATQVARKSISKNETLPENDVNNKCSENIIRRRPTHILVDSGVASPAHTNITMDATFTTEVNGTSFLRKEERCDTENFVRGITNYYDAEEEDDNLSTITPVLDRYRLDPSDNNSSGLKVVPNKRSAHRSNKKQTPTPRQGRLPTIAQLSPSLDCILHARTPKKYSNATDFISPQATTSERHLQKINANTSFGRNRKVYRKTPFPKKKIVNMEEDEGENHDPNNSIRFSILHSPETFDRDQEAFSISVPPLRHSSFEPKRTDLSILHLGGEEMLSFNDKQRSSIQADPPSALFPDDGSHLPYFQEETNKIQKTDETIERIDNELSSPSRSYNVENAQHVPKRKVEKSSEIFVDEITEIEFESAPRIVRTSVSRDLANQALHAIHVHCSESMVQFDCFEFTEEEGCDIVGFSKQETKSILISLCHWRRLMMKRDVTQGIIFNVNDRKNRQEF